MRPVLPPVKNVAARNQALWQEKVRGCASTVQILPAARIAREGASFLLAPEGTRSRTGKLLPFKKGGFYLAIDSEVPILPITVSGAYELMPPGTFAIRPGTIEIFFHDPVPTVGLNHKDRQRLAEEVRGQIGERLADRVGV